MSAVMQIDPIELRLNASRQCPRRLVIELSAGRHVYVYVYGKTFQTIASASAELGRVTLHTKWASIIVDGAHFSLMEAEAAEVERVFGPHGMKIDRSELRA